MRKDENIRKYECLYIIASNVEEAARTELTAKFQKMAGAGTSVEKWGLKKFATPIDYRKEGFYVLMNFSGDTALVAKMSALMNITEGVVRYMFVCKDEKQIAQDIAKKAARREARAAREAQMESGESRPEKPERPKREPKPEMPPTE